MARRPVVKVAGQKHAHDDFEALVVEVMHQEKLDQTIRRLDAEIDKDESRARGQAPPTPPPARRPRPPRPDAAHTARPRARAARSMPGQRDKGAGKVDKRDPGPGPGRSLPGADILTVAIAGLILAIAGSIFTVIVRLHRALR